ncbi:SAM-dependent methyltransferase [Prosthecomicrobium hirschii]|uniref:Magnesium protoporphyrin IX methyltransferase n=1 Tax=Prosthecodimorpha hirschii TaxID=665126 RepID=A0A0P6VL66_9HYPH|nr:magnesium protoporphyrin IX methyltransferase [Prosthecomicrobium hirschii]KPL53424.1 SAM-dependent methyltransferase [Prosthecomicrobium hirschii]
MTTQSYTARRHQLETYFDRTAVDAWARLTSDAPVGRIRRTVRAGRDEMRATLLSWLPHDLSGMRILDAGCGTGALAAEAARRGARVVGVDISPKLIELGRERLAGIGPGSIDLIVGDLLDPALGVFDHVVAMDSLIHYPSADVETVLASLAQRTRRSILFTFAPSTPLLASMHAIGQFFPRSDRSPAIEPIAAARLARRIDDHPGLGGWLRGRSRRVARGFYISQAQELVRT